VENNIRCRQGRQLQRDNFCSAKKPRARRMRLAIQLS
jgi:hypothetical protein